MTFAAGDPIVLRELWGSRIWEARAATVVEDTDERIMLYVPPKAEKMRAADRKGPYLHVPTADPWLLVNAYSSNRRVLSFAWPDTSFAVLMSWHADSGAFLGWYVNLQEPLRRTRLGFDTVDHVLDIVIKPHRGWFIKDEHELDEAIAGGLFTADAIAGFRAESKRAIDMIESRAEPFDDSWQEWRPDSTWHRPTLVPGWDSLEGQG